MGIFSFHLWEPNNQFKNAMLDVFTITFEIWMYAHISNNKQETVDVKNLKKKKLRGIFPIHQMNKLQLFLQNNNRMTRKTTICNRKNADNAMRMIIIDVLIYQLLIVSIKLCKQIWQTIVTQILEQRIGKRGPTVNYTHLVHCRFTKKSLSSKNVYLYCETSWSEYFIYSKKCIHLKGVLFFRV